MPWSVADGTMASTSRRLRGGPHLGVNPASSRAYRGLGPLPRHPPRSDRGTRKLAPRSPGCTPSQRAGTVAATAAAGLSTDLANWSSEPPSGESALVNMNGAPEFRALIAPRYSFTTW